MHAESVQILKLIGSGCVGAFRGYVHVCTQQTSLNQSLLNASVGTVRNKMTHNCECFESRRSHL